MTALLSLPVRLVRSFSYSVGFLFVLGLIFGTVLKVEAVRWGVAVSTSKTFMGPTDRTGDNMFGYPGTANVVKYDRCLVTARHVWENQSGNNTGVNYVLMGSDIRPSQINDNTKRQKIRLVGKMVGTHYETPWTDFAVLWLANYQDGFKDVDDETGKSMIQAGRDYTPWSLERAENFGLTAIDYDDDITVWSPEGRTATGLEGYGARTSEWVDPPGFWSGDTGLGVLRYGAPDAVAYYLGSSVSSITPGSSIRTIPDQSASRIGCLGDSGAGLWKYGDAKIYGVLSMAMDSSGTLGAVCMEVATNLFVTFDNTNETLDLDDKDRTNWDRINKLVETTCGQGVGIVIENFSGKGNVTGSFTPAWNDPDNHPNYNGIISCGDGVSSPEDCGEFMHQGDSITLTATPVSDSTVCSKFDRWQVGGPCVCVQDETNPVCTITFGDLGVYSAEQSLDGGQCGAKFISSCGDQVCTACEQNPSTHCYEDCGPI